MVRREDHARPTLVHSCLFHVAVVPRRVLLGNGNLAAGQLHTFQAVTGEKTDHLVTGRDSDHWLVKTVGVLITAIALALLTAAWRKTQPLEIGLLCVFVPLGLTAIDILYVIRGVIKPNYLVDAAAEGILIIGWLALCWKRHRWVERDRAPPQKQNSPVIENDLYENPLRTLV